MFKIPKADYLRIKALPKSNKTEISEILSDGTIKIRLKAAPEKGRANEELIKFLSQELQIAQSQISILAGKSEQTKLIKINWTP